MSKSPLKFVLITPAHNEEDFIENTIKSVIAQETKPLKWIIVSDGSTDKTDELIQNYAKEHSFIEYLRLPEHRDRQFAAKVTAFNAGYEKLNELEYDIIGNLDADITFEKDYFSFLMKKFFENDKLGCAGTPFIENGVSSKHGLSDLHHVSGACQMFRKECFNEIGGYIPIRGGGIDWVAVTSARMKGWQTQTFLETSCYHHRKIGTGKKQSTLQAKFNYGQKDYYLGGHLLWQVFRTFFQMTKKPFLVGGLMLGFGYFYQMIFHHKRNIPKELIKFHQSEQLLRLKKILKR
ncbi:MAG: glycosyltransferase family 2 protein [Spirochaetes bacterium]|nr:glycosyltransferase family 2 protein [Spirochaetota bacterium]